MTKLRVGVLFGGKNTQHDLSCDSAARVLRHLNRERFEPVPVRLAEDGTWGVAPAGEIPARPDTAELKALTTGTDTGAGTLASAVTALGSVDVVLPVLLETSGADDALHHLLDVPYVACGVSADLDSTLLRAEGIEVAGEQAIRGREIGISVLEHPDGRLVASPPVHRRQDTGRTELDVLAPMDAEIRAALADVAIRAFRVLECSGLVGFDFVIHHEGDRPSIVLNDVDTHSCLVSGSPHLAAWNSTGLSYTGLLDIIIDTGLARGVRSRAAHQGRSAPAEARSLGITIYGCGPDEAALFRSMAPRLGVVPTITEEPVSEANALLAPGNQHISVSHKTKITPAALSALSQAGVKYISTRSIGFNHIDVTHAESVGIAVGNIAYSPDSVADYTLMLMLMAVRHAKSIVLRAEIHDYRLNDTRGRELRDLTVGVVGTGRIGTAVMDRLRGFGCRILAYDSYPKPSAANVSLDELLQQSDIVTLHTPLNADSHHLLSRRRIEQMKRGAFLINTGRGPLVDTEALVRALENGALGGAALDVLEGEEGIFYEDCREKQTENKLLVRLQEMPNVIISPHTAYYTDHALSDTVENSIVNCLTFESEYQRG